MSNTHTSKACSVYYNGKSIDLAANTNLQDFIDTNQIESQFIAIAINMSLVPKSSYKNHILKDGDQIEILSPQQGG